MKANLFLISLLLVMLFGCEPPVTFSEPQPEKTDNLADFPKRIQGKYMSTIDQSILIIEPKLICRISDFDYKFHKNELDSNSILSGDTLTDIMNNQKSIISWDGDSIIAHIHLVDTIYQLNYDNVLRKFKGFYFMNTRYKKESWVVKKIEFSKAQLTISSISTKQEIDKLSSITETPIDTVPPYKFSPTKKQFKEFVKSEGFEEGEVFIPIGRIK